MSTMGCVFVLHEIIFPCSDVTVHRMTEYWLGSELDVPQGVASGVLRI